MVFSVSVPNRGNIYAFVTNIHVTYSNYSVLSYITIFGIDITVIPPYNKIAVWQKQQAIDYRPDKKVR